MAASPKVSILTATWNCAETLEDCLASVSKQTYSNFEHIIIDGASTDGTVELIIKHIDQIDVFITEQDSGIYDALNKGINLATGDVVGFLHADDIFASEDVIANIAKAFRDPDVCAVYGDLIYVNKANPEQIIRHWRDSPFKTGDLTWGWMAAHPTLYVRRDWYLRIGGFDTSYSIAADYHSIIKLFLCADFNAIYIPEVLVVMRSGGASNKSLGSIIKKSKEDWLALRDCGFSRSQALTAILCKNARKLPQFSLWLAKKIAL